MPGKDSRYSASFADVSGHSFARVPLQGKAMTRASDGTGGTEAREAGSVQS
jgi:hypothetical protein